MIQIMGAGALGCLIGALLQLHGKEVIFVARGKQLQALKDKLVLMGLKSVELKVKAVEKPENAEITFFTVKAYDTEEAARILSKVDPGIVCTLQNGIGVEKIIGKYLKTVVRGVTSYGANLADYGKIIYAGEGCVYLPSTTQGKKVAKVLEDANIRVELVDNIDFRVWAKAVVNAAINPLTAICRVRNGIIVENENLWSVAVKIAEEGELLMQKIGYKFDAISEVRKVAEMTAKNRSSMLQDIERGRRTEIDYINGEIVKKCREFGLKCEVNEIVWKLVKGIENGINLRNPDLCNADL
ncbi:MAG: 2-dehydropantoate 2-reductase [Archaeoglobaceae archaeon]